MQGPPAFDRPDMPAPQMQGPPAFDRPDIPAPQMQGPPALDLPQVQQAQQFNEPMQPDIDDDLNIPTKISSVSRKLRTGSRLATAIGKSLDTFIASMDDNVQVGQNVVQLDDITDVEQLQLIVKELKKLVRSKNNKIAELQNQLAS